MSKWLRSARTQSEREMVMVCRRKLALCCHSLESFRGDASLDDGFASTERWTRYRSCCFTSFGNLSLIEWHLVDFLPLRHWRRFIVARSRILDSFSWHSLLAWAPPDWNQENLRRSTKTTMTTLWLSNIASCQWRHNSPRAHSHLMCCRTSLHSQGNRTVFTHAELKTIVSACWGTGWQE